MPSTPFRHRHRPATTRLALPQRTKTPAHRRLGAAVVEFAVVAPIMMMLTFGLIEIGRLSMLKDSAVHASREGARAGIKPTASVEDARAIAEEELANMGISGGSVEVSFSGEGFDEKVSVSVTVPVAGNSWIPHSVTSSVGDVQGTTTMRRESTN